MPPRSTEQPTDLIREFRRALRDCRRLYRQAAERCGRECADGNQGKPSELAGLMDDLHRGLVVKVFVEMARVDWKWAPEERDLAGILFQHVWGRSLEGPPLEQSIKHVIKKSDSLKWAGLLRPFARNGPACDEAANLTVIVGRLANVVAKIDGCLAPEEARQLMHMQDQLARNLEQTIPLEKSGQSSASEKTNDRRAAPPATAQGMRRTAEQVRDDCQLKPSRPRVVEKSRTQQLDEALDELDQLVGLSGVKQEVRTLANFLKMQQVRRDRGLPETRISLHMVFQGNPGTGKTTVARFVGRIFGAMGILERGHLIETDRSGLVAQYAGQTGPKTNAKIDEALGGVLFIDEAYSLVSDDRRDAYGHEAVQTLLKRMEDDRDRLVVILAGYTEPMERLLRSNPGLSSRFNRQLQFVDYSAAELGRIFETMSEKNRYRLPAMTRAKLLLGFQYLVEHRDERFGNGRLARNVFEQAIRRQANRLAPITQLDRKLLTTLEPTDIAMRRVPECVWSRFDEGMARLRITCPECAKETFPPIKYLGRRVRCRRCNGRFRAAWGDVVAE